MSHYFTTVNWRSRLQRMRKDFNRRFRSLKNMLRSTNGGNASRRRKNYTTFKNRRRANLSFFLVIVFFVIFGAIAFMQPFFISESDKVDEVFPSYSSLPYRQREKKSDYVATSQSKVNGEVPVELPIVDKVHETTKMFREAQLPPYPANVSPVDGAWQTVGNTENYKFFVFSAFYDPRKKERVVRVIATTKTHLQEIVWCRLWYRQNRSDTNYVSRTVTAKIVMLHENWDLDYSSCFVVCPLQIHENIPFAVSVVVKLFAPPENLLTIVNIYDRKQFNSADKFAVCVKPLHYEYNKVPQILEFIELNRILGVQHFTFYNHTIGDQVDCILRQYIDEGLVTLLPWKLDLVSQKEIRTEGLFAALNDCLYRSMYRFSHVLLIDFDEFIIPKCNDTLSEMITFLNERLFRHPTIVSYLFQNAFFYLQWEDDVAVHELSDVVAANLLTLTKTRRKLKLHQHGERSKYICRPELVVEAGNHFVWEYITSSSLMEGSLDVPEGAAILHHYRSCEYEGNDCIDTNSTVDKTAFRYKEPLVKAVKERYNSLKPICQLYDLQLPSRRVSTVL